MTVIARGDILINLDDRGAKTELRALEQDVKRTFRDLDNERARPRVDLDHGDFQRASKEVKAEIKSLQRQRARAVVNLDVRGVSAATAQIKILEEKLRRFDGNEYAALLKVNVDRDAERDIAKLSRTINQLTSGRYFANIGVNVDQDDLRRVEQELASRINKLQRQKSLQILDFDINGVARTTAEIKKLETTLDHVRSRIESHRPIELDAIVRPRDLTKIRNSILSEIRALEREQIDLVVRGDMEGVERVAGRIKELETDLNRVTRRRYDLKLSMPDFLRRGGRDDVDRRLSATTRIFEGLTGVVSQASNWWNNFGGSVLGAGIRLGPLTLRLRTALAVMQYIAPLLVSMVGAFGALASVIYTGLLGALGPAVAGIGALGFGMAGIVGIAGPLISDMGKAAKASQAYDKAVREHGKGSEQAAKKMEVLKNVMGNVGEETARSFRDINRLRGMWRRLTAGARPAFFDTIADGVRTAKDLMPLFARESTRTFQVAARGVQDWLRGLRGQEARSIFRSLFRGAQESIPNLQAALGNVATFLGRVAKAAMPLWNQFTRTIERWTQGWADAAKDGDGVRAFLKGLAEDTKSLGRFLGAAARVLHNLFMGGREAGRGFLDTMTQVLNRWADFLGTTKGQNAVHDFFQDSVEFAKVFFSIIGNIVRVFAEMGRTIQPVATAISKLVAALSSLGVLDEILLTGVIAALGVRMVGALGKALAAVNALKAGLAALATTRSLSAAFAAAGAARRGTFGLPITATTVATEAAAGAAGGRVASGGAGGRVVAKELGEAGVAGAAGSAATRVGILTRSLTALRAGFAAATGPIGLTVTAVGALAFGLTKMTDQNIFQRAQQLQDTFGRMKQFAGGAAQAQRNLTQAGLQNAQSTLSVKQAQEEVNRLRRQGKVGTDEYRQATLNLESAVAQQSTAEADLRKNIEVGTKAAHARVGEWRNLKRQAIESGASLETLRKIEFGLQKAVNSEIALNINAGRARRGLAAITGNLGQQMGFLVKQFGRLPKGDVIRRFFVRADTRQAESAIRNIQGLQRRGVPDSTIIRILANSDSAEDAVRRLRAALNGLKDKNVRVTAQDTATGVVSRLRGRLESIVRPYVAALVGNDRASGVIRKVRGMAQGLVRAFVASLNARDGASPVIRGALGLLNAFAGRNVTSTITTIHKTIRAPGEPPRLVRGKAEGGIGFRAAKFGGQVNRLTFVTGEENRREFIISENPAYRRRNRKILHHAAAALGINIAKRGDVDEVLREDRDRIWEFPAFKKGGMSKSERQQARQRRQQRRTDRQTRTVGRLKRRWHRDVRGEQRKVESIEQDIRNKIQKRDQDEDGFNIDLDNNPIVKTDPVTGNEYVDVAARDKHISNIEGLKNQTDGILARYEDLKRAIRQAIDKINAVIERWKDRLSKLRSSKQNKRRYGADNLSGLRNEMQDNIDELLDSRADAAGRLNEIGDKSRGEIRGLLLDKKRYDNQITSTRATNAASQGAAAGGVSSQDQAISEQLKAQAEAAAARADIAEAALRSFGKGATGGATAAARQAGISPDVFGSNRAAASAPAVPGLVGSSQAITAAATQAAVAAVTRATPSAPAGRSAGSGGEGGGGGPTIVIQTLHPADPETLDAIGRAATGGISLQGSPGSPREYTGL